MEWKKSNPASKILRLADPHKGLERQGRFVPEIFLISYFLGYDSLDSGIVYPVELNKTSVVGSVCSPVVERTSWGTKTCDDVGSIPCRGWASTFLFPFLRCSKSAVSKIRSHEEGTSLLTTLWNSIKTVLLGAKRAKLTQNGITKTICCKIAVNALVIVRLMKTGHWIRLVWLGWFLVWMLLSLVLDLL